jgi:hypothetical protein
MHGWMTNRHEGCVSTMLTESGFSIALALRRFKGLCDEMEGARPKARHYGVFSVLTMRRSGSNQSEKVCRSPLPVAPHDKDKVRVSAQVSDVIILSQRLDTKV